MTNDEREYLQEQLARWYGWFNRGSRLWSAVHNGSLVLAALLAGAATVVVKIGWLQQGWPDVYAHRDDVVAVLGFLATLITSVSAAGGFGRKWQTNRISRGRIERLQIAMSAPNADPAYVRQELQAIIQAHDEGIVGGSVK